jgi:NACHT domain
MAGRRARLSVRRALTLTALAALTLAVATAFAVVLRLRGLGAAANIAQLVSLPLALLPIIAALVKWWRDTRKPPVATPEDLVRGREQLASLLIDQWRTESQLRALDDPDPIPVRWRLTDREELMDVRTNRTMDVLTVASSENVRTLIAEFRKLRRRRLVILGGAGAGKTTLAVQILLELMRPGENASGPVPVLLSLTGWDVTFQDFREWVSDRIIHDYPALSDVGPHVVRALVSRNEILPILDGLDEMPIATQEMVVETLNRSMDGETQLVLTSRTEAYSAAIEAAGRVLGSAVVIEPEPVTAAAAADYLERCLPPVPSQAWRSILDRLRAQPHSNDSVSALAEIASSPLGLWLIRMAYISSGTDPSELLDSERFSDTTAVRAHLFDQLIWVCIQARPPSDKPTDLFRPRNQYDPQDVDRWLRFLAANLDRWETRDFDWARDTRNLTRPVRWPVTLGGFLARWMPIVVEKIDKVLAGRAPRTRAIWGAAAAILGLILPIMIASFLSSFETLSIFGNIVGVILAVAVLAAAATAIWLANAVRRRANPETGEVDWVREVDRDRYRARRSLIIGVEVVSFGLVYALLTGVVAGVSTGFVFGESPGRLVGVIVGGVVGLLTALQFFGDINQLPGTGARRTWYGIAPGPGIRSGMSLGIMLGGVSGTFFASIYTTIYPGLSDDNPLRVWLAFVLPMAAILCVVFVSVRSLLVPIVFSVASLLTAAVRLVLFRSAAQPSHKRPNSLELWQEEKRGQQLRMVQVVLTAVLIVLASIALCLAIRNTPQWFEFRNVGLARWLTPRLTDFDVTWFGKLRYVFAIVTAWLVTIPPTGHRGWRRWVVWFLVVLLVVVFWPNFARPDDFHVRLVGHFDDLVADFDLHAQAQLAGRAGNVGTTQTFDFAALIADGGFRTVLLGLVLLIGFGVVATFVGVADSGQSRVWWSTKVGVFWHSVRGRLPKDLMVFLDDAHRLGLMRAVGTAYQFRHAELQDHLARSADPDLPRPTPPGARIPSGQTAAVEL